MSRSSILVILETASNAVIAAISDNKAIPADGFVIYSEKLGTHRVFYYRQQIRLFPDGHYAIVWQHSSGHCSASDWESHFECLEAAALVFIQNKRGYYQADADSRADAAQAYNYELMREAA